MSGSAWISMLSLGALIICSVAGSASLAADERTAGLNLMPMPSEVQLGSGALRVDSSFSVALAGYREPRLDRAVERFLAQVSRQTALPLASAKPTSAAAALAIHAAATLTIRTDHASKEVQELGEDETYSLEVRTDGATLTAANPLGAMHGLQTFLQLVEVSPDGFTAPVVVIHDQPRFPWRGLMIDVGRHFIPLNILRRNLDGMEAVKMNVFHWHLSENQGFRAESKKFPNLHEMGSDGLFYTQEEIRELIEYARDRGIRVVPEFDMPGHSTAWFVGHAELASGPGPYDIERKWGIFDPAMDPSNERTYKFLDQLIGEMTHLFPDHYFHIGGDEVNGKQWDKNPQIQSFMKSHKLKDNAALQAYFSQRVQKLVTKHGKAVVGWDEVLVPGVPKDIVIQSWRGQASLALAASQGYRGILSSGYYLDLGWSAARHYAVDPLSGAAALLTPEQQMLILGGEACMWTEYVNADTIDSRIWPRNAAIAERLWSPQEVTDSASMYARMNAISARLEWLGLTHSTNYARMLKRIAGPTTPQEFAALQTLAAVVEPVKDYTRGELALTPATSATPLNRVIDSVAPESETARRFDVLVDAYLAGGCRGTDAQSRLRAELLLWRDNDAELAPLAQRSFLVKEVAPVSQQLTQIAAAGLAALDLIAKGGAVDAAWKAQQLAIIEQAKKPSAQLLLMPATSVQKLVNAAGSGDCSSAHP